MSYPKKYSLAIGSSLLITSFATLATGTLLYAYTSSVSIWLLPFFIFTFLVSYLILQFRIEKFIYGWVKSIYKEVKLLDEKNLPHSPVTTDMETLTREVERYAEDKKLLIETLNIREDYRKEFMGNVAHELKTPLFTVQGYILTLLDGAMKDEEVLKKYLEGASDGVERLVRIVDDLDMITQLEAGALTLKRTDFDVVSLIEDVFDLLEMNAKNKNIKLVFDQNYIKPIYVHADRDRMEQVVINLIVNSLKYGRKNGTTEVAIGEISDKKVLVRITDNGEGIPEGNLPRIFERFYRVDKSGSRKRGGSGLGLSIVKHIVEAHFEKIYIESQLGVGSEFSFTLEKSQTSQ